MLRLITFLLFSSLIVIQTQADEHDHIYKPGDEVVLWMNTVGPYSNRQETYNYYSLPFCKGRKEAIGHYHETLGEALLGVDLQFSGFEINFKKELKKTVICTKYISRDDADAFVFAVEHNYWFVYF
uniref:Transmembrane 9 superfamily member n=1 Tax=Meloidogyne incognita TaxID=6306 RepID=A0A914L0H3_MELIC